MSAQTNVKPLTHWAISRGVTLRFSQRAPGDVRGVIGGPAGEVAFRYDPVERTLHLPDRTVMLDEYGLEMTA